MKITILGSGTSTGVPEVGCRCEVCTSKDPRDNRLRTSVLVQTGRENILLDCGPDFRQQMINRYMRLDGVLISHEHYDHVGGLDDLRPFCRMGEIPVYAEEYVAHNLKNRMPYCFAEHKYPGVPKISLSEVKVDKPFTIGTAQIIPVRVMHGRLPILGYRINDFAYITDMLTMPDEEYDKLKGLDVLIINALRIETHVTHQNLEQALENAKRIGAKQTYFIHMSHQIGMYAEAEKLLPENVHFAYDGLVIE